jgi:hypothetical protein
MNNIDAKGMDHTEKAKELVYKYKKYFDDIITIGAAKQCALITVDEILNTHMFKKTENSGARTFWMNVKNEIEKL